MSTLTDYKYGDAGSTTEQTAVLSAVAETMASESPFLSILDFDELENNNISRQRMYFESDVQEHQVGDTWTKVPPVWQYRDAPLTILGDDVTVDNFGAQAGGDKKNALMASHMAEKAKGMSRRFDKLAIYGGTTAVGALSSSAMVGLLLHIARVESSATTDLDGWIFNGNDSSAHNTQCVFAASGASAALSIPMLDALRDAVEPKATDFIMSKLMRRKLQDLCRASSIVLNVEVGDGKLGNIVTRFGEQRVLVNDQIKDNMPDSSGYVTTISTYNPDTGSGDTSPVFCISMSKTGFCGINGQGMVSVENLASGGPMENLDAIGKRIKFYCGTALRQHKSAAVLLNANHSG